MKNIAFKDKSMTSNDIDNIYNEYFNDDYDNDTANEN